jgi:hypothetical protein
MTNFTNNLNKQLFTDLTPEEASTIMGLGSFKTDFDLSRTSINDPSSSSFTTQSFNIKPGRTISLATDTTSYDRYGTPTNSAIFDATIRNLATGNINKKEVSAGDDLTQWTEVTGGQYVIDLTEWRLNSFIYLMQQIN